jgi:hypothetical protein
MVIVVAAFICGAWLLARKYINRGEDLNKKAWEASYHERNLPVPESGPREGYWGARLGSKVPDAVLGWHEPEIHLAGLVDIDGSGRQFYRSPGSAAHKILIIGGSVAFGANASAISKTYFNVIGSELENKGIATEIVVIAAGAWKSIQELRALKLYLSMNKPELVVFLNGLNDLTNGSTSRTLYGEPTSTHDGSPWTIVYHSHDYAQRVSDYLANMAAAYEMVTKMKGTMLVVLQPSLNERPNRTRIEEQLLELTLQAHSSATELSNSYRTMANGLESMTRTGQMFFFDGSNLFDAEKESVFTDIWHFTDFGHRMLGKAMAGKIHELVVQHPELSMNHTPNDSNSGRQR